jgi:alpha-D-xyloside xylohydrolase
MDFANDKNVLDMTTSYVRQVHLVAPVLKAQYTPERMVRTNENDGWNKNPRHQQGGSGRIDFTPHTARRFNYPLARFGTISGQRTPPRRPENTQRNQHRPHSLVHQSRQHLPLGPAVQYVSEKNWESLDIRITLAPTAASLCTKTKAITTTTKKVSIRPSPSPGTTSNANSTISDRQGNFPGMLAQRTFQIHLATPVN